MHTALLWVHGWNSQFSHDHIYKYIPDIDIVVVPIRNCSTKDYTDNTLYREYHSDIMSICEDIDTSVYQLGNKYKNIYLYGHSRGGLAALLFCKYGTNNHRISKLILSDPMLNLGKWSFMVPYILNVHPLCWKLSFPYVVLRPKVDVLRSFGAENVDFRRISEILSVPNYKIRKAGTFSDQLMNYC